MARGGPAGPELVGAPPRAAGLYVHVPFCARACPYCDFDFVVGRRPALETYLEALRREAEARAVAASDFDTVYVGGGTPSLLGPAIGRLFELVAGLRGDRPLGEFTVEINPEHVDAPLVAALLGAGVDRVSLGVQSFDPEGLRQLGRAHGPAQARAAIEAVTAAGFATSVDLIVGWPGQQAASLEHDLAQATGAGVDHVSLYGLSVDGHEPWAKLVRRGLRRTPDPDRQAELLARADAWLTARGWDHYEIASYGRQGAVASHNAKYWSGAPFVGLGPSAASLERHPDGRTTRRTNPRGLDGWAGSWLEPAGPGARRGAAVAGGGRGRGRALPAAREPELVVLDPEASARELAWLALRRLDLGIELSGWDREQAPFGRDWLTALAARQLALGNLELAGDRLRLRRDRWLWHGAVAEDLWCGQVRPARARTASAGDSP